MIRKIKIKNFRNFVNSEFFFSEDENAIIWKNWKGKTNILEAIWLFSGINLWKINFDNLVNKNKKIFYIELELNTGEKLAISYDINNKTKKYLLNEKSTTKKKISEVSDKLVFFSPIIMNMMYLSPNLRRDFLDEILIKSFSEYKKILNNYKKILISRNKVLKNIKDWRSKKTEIEFWDETFIENASIVYNYRFWIIDFLEENTHDFTKFFWNKIDNFKFEYKTKIKQIKDKNILKQEKMENIKKQISKYLKDNLDRDIILSTTNIWPHIDDFDIYIDWFSIAEFASRWEVKSIIIWLKLLEIKFIEKYTQKKPILLIDDLLSELDDNHKDLLLHNIKWYQVFITSIREDYNEIQNIIKL